MNSYGSVQASGLLSRMHNSPANSLSSSMTTSPDSSLPPITPEYLQELLKDKRNLLGFPHLFNHVDRILETEIGRARNVLFHQNGSATLRRHPEDLPEGEGPVVTVQEKVYIPVKENPNYNFVGRLLGPRGMTAKQLESDLDCRIMVRGKGSMRDKKKEEQNLGKPNWEHLTDELHVLVCVEDQQNRAEVKVRRAAEEIRVFLDQAVKMPESEDRLKQMQLMEVAALNEATRASNAAAALSMAAAAAAAATSAAAPTALPPPPLPPGFLRLPQAPVTGHQPHHFLFPGQQQQPLQQQQQLLGIPIVQSDLSYLLAAAAAAGSTPPTVSDQQAAMLAMLYQGGGAEFAGQAAGPMKSRQGGASTAGLRTHPYSRPPF